MAALVALAGEPRAVPPERHEQISRVMLQLQQAQLAVSEAQRVFLEARTAYEKTQAQYQGLLAELQKEFEAPGCLLTLEKSWQCPQAREEAKKRTQIDKQTAAAINLDSSLHDLLGRKLGPLRYLTTADHVYELLTSPLWSPEAFTRDGYLLTGEELTAAQTSVELFKAAYEKAKPETKREKE